MMPRLFAVVVLVCFAVVGRAQTYEVTGRLEYSSERHWRFKQSFDFRVSVADARWNIRLVPVEFQAEDESFKPAPLDYVEAGSDGTNFFAVRSLESSAAERAREGVVNPRAFGVRGPGVVPFGVGAPNGSINHLWWMFASHRQLATNVSGLIMDPHAPRPVGREAGVEVTNDFRVPARWELETAAPGLPNLIVSGEHHARAEKNLARTNFVLRVSELGSGGGLRLPKRGEVRVSGNAGLSGSISAGKFATNVSVKEFVPRLPKGSLVTDYSGLGMDGRVVERGARDLVLRDEWAGE